jgi:hypothetical protein
MQSTSAHQEHTLPPRIRDSHKPRLSVRLQAATNINSGCCARRSVHNPVLYGTDSDPSGIPYRLPLDPSAGVCLVNRNIERSIQPGSKFSPYLFVGACHPTVPGVTWGGKRKKKCTPYNGCVWWIRVGPSHWHWNSLSLSTASAKKWSTLLSWHPVIVSEVKPLHILPRSSIH